MLMNADRLNSPTRVPKPTFINPYNRATAVLVFAHGQCHAWSVAVMCCDAPPYPCV